MNGFDAAIYCTCSLGYSLYEGVFFGSLWDCKPSSLQQKVDDLANKMGVKTPVKALEDNDQSWRAHGNALFGQAAITVPHLGTNQLFSDDLSTAILAREIAHIKNNDSFRSLLVLTMSVVLPILFPPFSCSGIASKLLWATIKFAGVFGLQHFHTQYLENQADEEVLKILTDNQKKALADWYEQTLIENVQWRSEKEISPIKKRFRRACVNTNGNYFDANLIHTSLTSRVKRIRDSICEKNLKWRTAEGLSFWEYFFERKTILHFPIRSELKRPIFPLLMFLVPNFLAPFEGKQESNVSIHRVLFHFINALYSFFFNSLFWLKNDLKPHPSSDQLSPLQQKVDTLAKKMAVQRPIGVYADQKGDNWSAEQRLFSKKASIHVPILSSKQLRTDDDLHTAILAHEISHIKHNDNLRLHLVFTISTFALFVIFACISPLYMVSGWLSIGCSFPLLFKASRYRERQADEEALKYLNNKQKLAFARFLKQREQSRLNWKNQEGLLPIHSWVRKRYVNAKGNILLSTHPSNQSRIECIYKSMKNPPPSASYFF